MKTGHLTTQAKKFLNHFVPAKQAAKFHCEQCLTEFSNDSLMGVERYGCMGNTFVQCLEEHTCPTCKKKWLYHTIRSSNFKYKFDK